MYIYFISIKKVFNFLLFSKELIFFTIVIELRVLVYIRVNNSNFLETNNQKVLIVWSPISPLSEGNAAWSIGSCPSKNIITYCICDCPGVKSDYTTAV
jgi:hypothetical protein